MVVGGGGCFKRPAITGDERGKVGIWRGWGNCFPCRRNWGICTGFPLSCQHPSHPHRWHRRFSAIPCPLHFHTSSRHRVSAGPHAGAGPGSHNKTPQIPNSHKTKTPHHHTRILSTISQLSRCTTRVTTEPNIKPESNPKHNQAAFQPKQIT